MQLELTNVINVSVSQTPVGVGAFNTSNLALFTHEAYASTFGTDGYKIYLEPTEVGVDFGTNSTTYKMAVDVFSQQPNILTGGGYLVVIPITVQQQHLAFDADPAAGSFELNFGGNTTAAINYDAAASDVQTALQALTGLENVVVTGSATAATGFTVTMFGLYGSQSLLTVSNDTLTDAGASAVTITVSEATAAETFDASITRTKDLVQYFGILKTLVLDQVDMLAAAAVVQALNKIAGFVSRTSTDVDSGGKLDQLRTGSYTKSRGLFYGGSTDLEVLEYSAAYFGRALSTDFSGSNTAQNMHLKVLNNIQPDPSMTQTLLNKCVTAGVDVYVSLQGVSRTFTSGANSFFDQVYNLQWFIGAIQVSGFNYLASVSTKIPQTEKGVAGLVGAYRKICGQALANGYAGAGSWTSPTTFGNQSNFLDNISQLGYYLYSTPVALQSQADRSARKAPLVQIALKEAGGVNSSNIIVNVNA